MPGWMELFREIGACKGCALCQTRSNVVPGEGNPDARVLFVGEGPGADEDRLGRPFVGASGQLLTGMIEAIGLKRSDVYIANVVKCRPPGNRTPTAAEAQACLPYLRRQTALIRPRIIVLLGGTAAKFLLGENVRIRRDHGVFTEKKGILFMPTFHPSALLRDPTQKKDAWADFEKLRDALREMDDESV